MIHSQGSLAGSGWAAQPLTSLSSACSSCGETNGLAGARREGARRQPAAHAGAHLHHQRAVMLHSQVHGGGPTRIQRRTVCPMVQQAGSHVSGVRQGGPVQRGAAVGGVVGRHACAPAARNRGASSSGGHGEAGTGGVLLLQRGSVEVGQGAARC